MNSQLQHHPMWPPLRNPWVLSVRSHSARVCMRCAARGRRGFESCLNWSGGFDGGCLRGSIRESATAVVYLHFPFLCCQNQLALQPLLYPRPTPWTPPPPPPKPPKCTLMTTRPWHAPLCLIKMYYLMSVCLSLSLYREGIKGQNEHSFPL